MCACFLALMALALANKAVGDSYAFPFGYLIYF